MLLFLDIEGTITDPAGRFMGRSLAERITEMEMGGEDVVLCSGRDLDYMIRARERWGLPPLNGAIAENGCLILPAGRPPKEAYIDPRAEEMDREKIISDLTSAGLSEMAEVDPDKRYILSIYAPGFMEGEDYTPGDIASIHRFVEGNIDDHRCQVIPTSASVEVIPAGVDKGTGIRRYWEMTGHDPEESAFICDSNNDIQGARVVKSNGGRVYVVGNGVDKLKEMADYVASGNYWKGALEILDIMDY